MPFINVPITTDADTLADEAVERLEGAWDEWEGNDGDMEVIQIETLAPMAQDVAETAALVPNEIFRNYGLNILGMPYNPGAPAVGSARFTAIDATGFGSTTSVEIALAGQAFTTDDPVVIIPGQIYVDVDITAVETGEATNGLWGFADLNAPLPWIESVLVAALTLGGSEPETDDEYRNRLSDRLQLQATTLITGRDFEMMAIEQEGIGRAMAQLNQARQVVVAIADDVGEPLSPDSPIRDTLIEIYEQYRQVNTIYSLVDPTYTTINVTFTVVALPGYDPAALAEQCEIAVGNWLSPANWGRPQGRIEESEGADWLYDNKVRYSEVLRTLSIAGVRYVQAATLNGGTVDVTLPGTAPLTRPGSIVGLGTIV